MVHPGYVDDALRQMPTQLLSSRAHEVGAARSETTADALIAERIQLVGKIFVAVRCRSKVSSMSRS